MNFNFSQEQNYVSTAKPRLKGGDIHKVNFKGIEFKTLDGKKDENMKYNVMQISFENENGYFTHMAFDPGDNGNTRRSFEWNGQEIAQPSPAEEMQLLVGQLLMAINPEGLAKLAGKNISGFEKLVKAVTQLTDPFKETEVEIKIMPSKDGTPRLPIFASLNRQGELYVSSNFIAKEGLFFTDKEKQQIEKILNATPTNVRSQVESDPLVGSEPSQGADNFDLDLDLE